MNQNKEIHTLELKHVTKQIKQDMILKEINLSLNSGKIYGIIGKNGSGKTMLFRLISGLIFPTSGEIRYDGNAKKSDAIGLVIENASLFPDLSGFDNLYMLSRIKKVIGRDEVSKAMLRVGLDPKEKKQVKKYSLGMKQRLLLAQAIMEKPDFLLLDEPTNGVDAQGVELVKKIILEEKERGALILLASHIAADMQVLCEERFFMKAGSLTPYEE